MFRSRDWIPVSGQVMCGVADRLEAALSHGEGALLHAADGHALVVSMTAKPWLAGLTPASSRPCPAVSTSMNTGAQGQRPQPTNSARHSEHAPLDGEARRLPGQVPVDPPEYWPGQRVLVPASRHDLTADRFSDTAQPPAYHCRLIVPRLAAQKMNAVDADADFRMVAQVDQGV